MDDLRSGIRVTLFIPCLYQMAVPIEKCIETFLKLKTLPILE